MRIAIVGNGAVAMSIAETLSLDPAKQIDVFGPAEMNGSATRAAGAMIVAFSELEDEQLEDPVQKTRFDLAFRALQAWPDRVERLQRLSGCDLSKKDKIYILRNSTSTPFEKKHIAYLEKCGKKYPNEILIDEKKIELKTEFSIDARSYINALNLILNQRSNVKFIEYSGSYNFHLGYDGASLEYEFGNIIKKYDKIVISAGAFTREIFQQNQLLFENVVPIFYGIGCALKLYSNGKNEFRGGWGPSAVRTMNRGGACGYHLVNCGGYEYFGATNAIHHSPEYHPRLESLLNLTEHLKSEFSETFSFHQVKPIVGFRPTPLDGMPLLGSICDGKIVIATGNKRDGLTCSPEVARQVKRLVEDESCHYSALRPDRPVLSYFDKKRAIDKSALSSVSGALLHNRVSEADFEKYYADEIVRLNLIYDRLHIEKNFGIHPELINMYDYDRI